MSTATITSREELLALVAEYNDREAIAFAATGPVEQVSAVPARRLAVEAPALPPLKMPKLSDRTLNGKRVEELLKAGKKAGIVHTPRGVRVVPDLAEVADDGTAVLLTTWREASRAVTLDGKTPLEVAVHVLDRELDVLERLALVA